MSRKNSTRRKTRRPSSRRLTAQKLQDRQLMAGDLGEQAFMPDITFDGTDVKIAGSKWSDQVQVSINTQGTSDRADDHIEIVAKSQFGEEVMNLPRLDANGNNVVRDIVFEGFGGNDRFSNSTDRTSKVWGGDGNDSLYGGSNQDFLFGEDGRDYLFGSLGDDRLVGGEHNDRMYGGFGDDYMDGSGGNDYMHGGHGDDEMRGKNGKDRMYGGLGDDFLRGGSGSDKLYGHNGNDTLMGESGHDHLYGQNGKDLLDGGSGNDVVNGGAHNDVLIGGDGADKIFGMSGDDRLYAGKASLDGYLLGHGTIHVINGMDDNDDDDLYGGLGSDEFVIGDYGWFDIDRDRIKDIGASDDIFYRDGDLYGLLRDAHIREYGHLAED